MKLLIIFILLNAINVVIQTIKSLLTVKGGKVMAAVANAIAYGFYTIVVIYMVCELPLWQKVVIVGGCNFIGVYIVKLIEEKMRRDKLWKVEATIPVTEKDNLLDECVKRGINHYNYVDINRYYIFNFFCNTQQESRIVRELLKEFSAKYFVSESKIL